VLHIAGMHQAGPEGLVWCKLGWFEIHSALGYQAPATLPLNISTEGKPSRHPRNPPAHPT
jgi:hypothetical protein